MIKSEKIEIFHAGLTARRLAEIIRERGICISLDAQRAIDLLPPVCPDARRIVVKIASAGELGVASLSDDELCGKKGAEYLKCVQAKPLDPIDALLLRSNPLCQTPEEDDCIWCIHPPVAIYREPDFIFCCSHDIRGVTFNVVPMYGDMIHPHFMLAVEDLS